MQPTELRLCHWNVNGWSQSNHELRTVLLKSLDPYFISLNETHLSDSLELDGFIWFGHNRIAHRRAVKASGGVGICVKKTILDSFSVIILDKAYDGIIALRFEANYSFVIISCYLSPEMSPWGRDADLFFSHLLTLLYTINADATYLCGDLNSRISDVKDYIEADDIPDRTAIDMCLNKHGQSFVDFLKDSKCCVLNGRLNSKNDNFTSISVRGRAVVDYIFTPHADLKTCLDFCVYTPSELVDGVGSIAANLIDVRSRLPDHSVLYLRFLACDTSVQNTVVTPRNIKRQPRHLPPNFLSSEICQRALLSIIDKLTNGSKTQESLDLL